MRYYRPPLFGTLFRLEGNFSEWSIAKRLLFAALPTFMLLLAISGVIAHRISQNFLHDALGRSSLLATLAQAHEMEQVLQQARRELLYLARTDISAASLAHHLRTRAETMGTLYREIAYQGATPDNRLVLLNTGRDVWMVPLEQALATRFGPLTRQNVQEPKPGFVRISAPTEVVYPSVPTAGTVQGLSMHVLRLTTPVMDAAGNQTGLLTLSVDMLALRNVLSVYASRRSPLYIFPEETEKHRSFFFDAHGWILFQSESPEHPNLDLSTDTVRSGMRGDFGRPGFEAAFRPNPEQERYWGMVTEVQTGNSGQSRLGTMMEDPSPMNRAFYISYAPVTFSEGPGTSTVVVGGIAYTDTSFLAMAASYKLYGALFVFGLCASAAAAFILGMLGRGIAGPLHRIAEEASGKLESGDLAPIELGRVHPEAEALRHTTNELFAALQSRSEDLRLREEHIQSTRRRQRVCLDTEIAQQQPQSQLSPQDTMPGIVGTSEAVRGLRGMIRKAAGVEADVLIIGETGTGKELAAEAIHMTSDRSGGPFISINCGALDENLLLDALFGHVKGAFSEARGERKGAFVAADGGTLHLDEIGNASPKVQQALLRALSVRRIRPLGSDDETPFNARIIAATNVDLKDCARQGTFREDLYYRLAVITINTPPLRDRREDIPALADYFLKQAAQTLKRPTMGLSRGALEKLLAYDWPGNVREVKNCITRAVAFAEGDTLYAEDLRFGAELDPTLSHGALLPPSPVQPGMPAAQGAAQPSLPYAPGSAPHGYGQPGAPNAYAGDAAYGQPHGSVAANGGGTMYDPVSGRIVAAGNGNGGPDWSDATSRSTGAAMSAGAGGAGRNDRAGMPPANGRQQRTGPDGAPLPPLSLLNPRQRAAWEFISRNGGITRTQYQDIVGNEIPVRTAQYDLQDMVGKGFIHKVGKGPATRYVLTDGGAATPPRR